MRTGAVLKFVSGTAPNSAPFEIKIKCYLISLAGLKADRLLFSLASDYPLHQPYKNHTYEILLGQIVK
jgi:hypothetical protein